MKQLIPQERIDEAASKLPCNDIAARLDFNAGVQFTLNEMQPLMIEFRDWCDNLWLQEQIKMTKQLSEFDKCDAPKIGNTKQLLEEFINSKNKEE